MQRPSAWHSPRGQHEDILETDYRVPYNHIHRIFLLPKLDDLHIQLVLGLDPPIRQGATRYPFLVAQWPKDEETDVSVGSVTMEKSD
jgi:structure-specific recognition protein 1